MHTKMPHCKLIRRALGSAVLAFVLAPIAYAIPLTVNGLNGSLSAQAIFTNVGGSLQITLTNTAPGDIDNAGGLLTGLFYNLSGNPLLTRTSVVLNAGSTLVNPVSGGGGTVVGGEFAYNNTLSVGGANQGVGNSGLGGIFGSSEVFPGGPLPNNGGTPPNGPEYGIVSAGWVSTGDNGSLSGRPLIKNSVVITLGGFGLLTDPSLVISRVQFAYGTTGTPFEGYIPPSDIPPPVPDSGSTLILGGLAMIALGYGVRRFGHRKA